MMRRREAKSGGRPRRPLRLADLAIVVVFTVTVTVGMVLWQRVERVPEPEVLLPAVLATALDDYQPGFDPIIALDSAEARANADYCWDRYVDVVSLLNRATHRADSLGHELIALQVRMASGE